MVILTIRYLVASYRDLVRCGNRSGDAQLDRFEGAPEGPIWGGREGVDLVILRAVG
jgi:hypothetical protein